MSTVVARPPVKSGDNTTPSVSPAAPSAVEFRYTQTESFVALLQQLGASLLPEPTSCWSPGASPPPHRRAAVFDEIDTKAETDDWEAEIRIKGLARQLDELSGRILFKSS